AAVRRTPRPVHDDAPVLAQHRGLFVTLMLAGRLRGCMGRIEPDGPLAEMLPEVAVLSATGDPRFPPVSAAELDGLEIEISLLTVPEVTQAGDIEVGRHGLIVAARGHRGLLLPQVATEYGWDAEEFLAQTCYKAGLPPDAWRHRDTRLQRFETEIFGE
ncbi:MAG TPA: AmmeMemoRadiSam system protein A, partial [Candidatus Krumholzibacteria bacterium]|nr:AmmeMemoRadiSam system protein A [Candidatus Krumholzibacteria bacterium]